MSDTAKSIFGWLVVIVLAVLFVTSPFLVMVIANGGPLELECDSAHGCPSQ